ncbi:MAG: hypothetical protein ABEN55_17255, partial [Bradymonadaceae bacterium]
RERTVTALAELLESLPAGYADTIVELYREGSGPIRDVLAPYLIAHDRLEAPTEATNPAPPPSHVND